MLVTRIANVYDYIDYILYLWLDTKQKFKLSYTCFKMSPYEEKTMKHFSNCPGSDHCMEC